MNTPSKPGKLKWERVGPGHYRARTDDTLWEVVRLSRADYRLHPGERERWLLYANGAPVDATETLAAAKGLVQGS